MKRLTICIYLLSAILLCSCSEVRITPSTEQQKEVGTNETTPNDDETKPNNPYTANPLVGENIELGRFNVNTLHNNTFDPLQFEFEELNMLKVIRNESDYEILFKEGTYIESGIDFDTHTLLLVPVRTNYGIAEISQTLQYTGNGYVYSMDVTMGMWCVISNKVHAVLAPAIGQGESVAFDLDIS